MTQRLARAAKRALDIIVALLAIILLSPLFALLPFAIRINLGTPIIFTQPRPGKNGRIFTVYKYRTMTDALDEAGNLLPDEVRLTPFGQILRKWSLDELPQLWNVLKGDMSLVGPRPLLVMYLSLYDLEQTRRHDVTPGLTGWAQVNGRNAISWEERFKLDVWYVDNWSLCLDVKILSMTVLKVLKRSDVIHEGHASMPKFTGIEEDVV